MTPIEVSEEPDCASATNFGKKIDNARHLTALSVERIAIVSSDAIIHRDQSFVSNEKRDRHFVGPR